MQQGMDWCVIANKNNTINDASFALAPVTSGNGLIFSLHS
jgi:hypothetical protein